MLDTFRKNQNSSLVYLIFGSLIFIFAVNFGAGTQGFERAAKGGIGGSTEFAAKVNDGSISVSQYNRAYSQTLAQYQERAGGQLTPELAEQLGLRKTVMEQLVQQELLYQEAQRRGLYVGDDELAHKLFAIKAFQKNGRFDAEQYQLQVSRGMGMSKDEFEKTLRRDLMLQKMAALIEESATASDTEVRALYDREHNKVDLDFVRFGVAAFLDQVKDAPKDPELAKFTDEKAKEIDAFYTRNTARYHKAARVQARHVLVRLADGAPAADEAKAKAKADQAYADLKAGKEFAEVAKTYSDDTNTKDKGGELGVFGPGSMDKKVEEAVKPLKEGGYTEPIRTHFGFQILQVEKLLPAEDKKLDEVKKDIALELWKNEQAKKLAQAKAQDALTQLAANKTLAQLFPADEKKDDEPFAAPNLTKIEVQNTGAFGAEGDFVPKIGPAPELAKAAFALSAKAPLAGKVFEVNNALYVIQMKTRETPSDADFETAKKGLVEQVLQQKRSSLLSSYLKELKASAKVEQNDALTMPSGKGQPVGPS
jgi:peptidyl-prolyl cis-trans isomerase D